jgi:hypothetical protein
LPTTTINDVKKKEISGKYTYDSQGNLLKVKTFNKFPDEIKMN